MLPLEHSAILLTCIKLYLENHFLVFLRVAVLHPGKSQLAIGFLRNSGMDPLKNFSEEVRTAVCEIL